MAWMRDARSALQELNHFATAAQALTSLFERFEEDATRAWVLTQLLKWQAPAQATRAVGDIVAQFDALNEEDHTAAAAGDTGGSAYDGIDTEAMLLVMGKPALLFATSIYDEELALLVWNGFVRFQQHCHRFDLLRQVFDNACDSHGFCALHYAIEAQMDEFVARVANDLLVWTEHDKNESRTAVLKQICARVVTQDVVLPVGKNQIQGKNIASGGSSLLHVAARKGELGIVKMLLAPPFEFALSQRDWDGNTSLRLAALYGHDSVAALLQPLTPSEPILESASLPALQAKRDALAKARYIASLETPASMLQSHKFPKIWSQDECREVLSVLERVTTQHGWCTQRHAAYPTTDMPCYRVVPIESWVRGTLVSRLFSQLYDCYAIPRETKQITFRELFYVKYEAKPGERAELGIHCDGSVLSFNVLLNNAAEFTGGGTFFEATKETIHITQGDAVVHSGKVRHAGAPVLEGKRMILVGFLDIVDRVFSSYANGKNEA
uniref:Fe2OG dioxygenase domain-containing protein n=1 Tax=Globisporangium ultimum (strain ATCC 200006 / CBS 805.95 / DAOM BR144) TaxID=431595 RepID=K3W6X8_GLOUD